MVAIRQTHSADFNFQNWLAALPLDAAKREAVARTFAMVADTGGDRAQECLSQSEECVEILASLGLDTLALEAGVLYPFVVRKLLTTTEVAGRFSGDLAQLLDKVRDLEALRFLGGLGGAGAGAGDDKVDRVRRMLLAMVDDVRAVVVKLAERIAVIRAAAEAPAEKRVRLAQEISAIYAPLANRLGIGQLKWELEDLAFKFLHPEEYADIAAKLHEKRVERERYIAAFVAELKAMTDRMGIKAEISGRPKHIYSIWRKMQRKRVPFEQIYDARAVRVLVDSIEDCYAVLSAVHTGYERIPEEFDDYIARPKANGYQSLHTVVYGSGHKAIEVQIRTRRMHGLAEQGVAAHWKYKEGGTRSQGVEERISWLRRLMDWRDDLVESGALYEEYKQQVFENMVYVFTPRGEVMDLPTGSTPLDFAYRVHTMVGHRCIGAKVDGRIVPFTYVLHTGEQVEIITKRAPGPSRDWLNADNGFLKTAKARSKVAAWFKQVDYERNQTLGQEAVERELSRRSFSLRREELTVALGTVCPRLNFRKTADLLAAVGAGTLTAGAVLQALEVQGCLKGKSTAGSLPPVPAPAHPAARHSGDVIVAGEGNVMTHLAHCCRPVPGDDIAGFVTAGRGVSVHRRSCREFERLKALSPERQVAVRWSGSTGAGYPVALQLDAEDGGSLLAEVSSVLNAEHLRVMEMNLRRTDMGRSIIRLSILVPGLEAVNRITVKLRRISGVSTVSRG